MEYKCFIYKQYDQNFLILKVRQLLHRIWRKIYVTKTTRMILKLFITKSNF